MNGFQLLRKMQVHTPDVPYLFATGFADWAELQKEKGIDTGQILFKPFTRMELSDAIRMTLRRHNVSFL
jgi:DNA-binding response OmpR family regulator